jgi:hypothetical protein
MTRVEALRQALAVTRRAISIGTTDEAELAIQLRAPLLEQAARGVRRISEQERLLVHELMEADVVLIQTLWAPTADSYTWLAERRPERIDDLPHLRQLAGG